MPRSYIPFRMNEESVSRFDKIVRQVGCNRSWGLRYIFDVGLEEFDIKDMKDTAKEDPTSRPRIYEDK